MNPRSQDTPTPNSSQELQKIVGALSKITSCSPEEIKPHLKALIDRLSHTKEENTRDDLASASFYTNSTHEEWSAEFHDWVNSHKGKDIPVLSDEAMSRESMYPDRW
jgi:hypothetical protein